MRIGFGYDVHRLVRGRELILGGVAIPFEKGLQGHSDADALCHAIGDALLGSLALGDLGTHFPPSDERYTGISSLLLLKEISTLVSRHGFVIGNVDSTVVLEQPKLLAFIPEMRKNIAESLGIAESRVSVKATTAEKLGFVGQGKGVAVYATVLIEESETTQ